ncbi:hypothetical protein Dsin_023224, partial [Dipteronia sinensis]
VFSSSFDWLLTIRRKPNKVRLLNPITREQIKLPLSRILFERSNDFRVIITSTSPLDPECLVIVQNLYHPSFKFSVIYCRPGADSYWKVVKINRRFNDLIFHKGELYWVDYRGELYSTDIFRCFGDRVVKSFVPPIDSRFNYLVEVEDDLLLVTTSIFRDTFIVVYKLDWIEKKWIRVRSVGNYAILLGRVYRRCSVSIPINCFRNFFKADCIYFQDKSTCRVRPNISSGEIAPNLFQNGDVVSGGDECDSGGKSGGGSGESGHGRWLIGSYSVGGAMIFVWVFVVGCDVREK